MVRSAAARQLAYNFKLLKPHAYGIYLNFKNRKVRKVASSMLTQSFHTKILEFPLLLRVFALKNYGRSHYLSYLIDGSQCSGAEVNPPTDLIFSILFAIITLIWKKPLLWQAGGGVIVSN